MHPGPRQTTSPAPTAAPAQWPQRLRAAAPWGVALVGVGLATLLGAWTIAAGGLGLAIGLLLARRWPATAWRSGPIGDLDRLLRADPHTCLVDAEGRRLHGPHGAPDADWLAEWGEDADRMRQALLEALLGGQSHLRACRPAPDGGRTHWDIHLLRIEGGQGRTARMLVRMRDLQAEVDARAEAAQARSQREVLVDAIADAYIELDAEGRVSRANPAAERLFERPAAGMLGRSLWEAIPGMESTALAAFLRSLDGRGGSDRTEVFHPPARRWLAVTAHAGPKGSLLFLADISARVEALEELRHKTARLELVQAVGRFGGWDYLPDEGALQLDDNALWLVGADASLPRSAHRQALMGALQPEARLRLIDALLASLNARSELEIELPLRPDSPTGAGHVRLVGRWSDSGGRPLMLGALQDISAEQAQREELRSAGRFARAITEALPLDIRVIQADGIILSRNRAQGDWPADSHHPLAGDAGDDYLALCEAAAAAGCPDAQRIAEAIDDVAQARRSEARLEWRPAAGDDEAGHEWYRCTVTPLSLRDRDRLVVAHEDISHQKRLEHAVHAQDERLREITRHMPDVLWTFDVEANRLLFISDNVEGMFGLPASVFHADPYAWRRLVHPEDATAPQDAFARYSRGEATEWGYRLNHPDGSLRWIEERAFPVLDAQGRLLRVVGISADVTQRRLQEAALHRVSNFDTLTGLPNRTRFNELLADACHAGAGRTALLLVNLDHFKRLNDVLGIRQGDELIRQSGERLLRLSGEGWLLARVGGDEFGALLPLGPERPTPAAEASRILAAFAEPFSIEGDPVFATVSIGFAEFGRDASDPEGLFTAADGALAVAKRSGRNRYAQYDPAWQQASARQLSLETELRGALDRRQFELFFQPKLDLRSGRLSGAEALLRWRHPERGLVSPADFIPLLEDSGLILPVGRWVLEGACAQRAAWQGLADADFVMAANLSAHQLQDEGLVEHVADLLARYGLRGERIELEITESALMREPEQGLRLLQRLRALDLRIAVDDFGTGYSSLAYLHRFDPDTVKLDRSFVEPILSGEKTRKFVSGIIGLAHTLGQHVVAEGVESQAQLALLRQLGCDAIQGFAYGRPMPANEFGALFTQARASAAQGLAPAPDPCENPPPKRP